MAMVATRMTWGRSLVGFLASALRLTMSMPPAVAQVSSTAQVMMPMGPAGAKSTVNRVL